MGSSSCLSNNRHTLYPKIARNHLRPKDARRPKHSCCHSKKQGLLQIYQTHGKTIQHYLEDILILCCQHEYFVCGHGHARSFKDASVIVWGGSSKEGAT
eukprot:3605237-Amphidinium_carterae.1